jgi:hypothetical protein
MRVNVPPAVMVTTPFFYLLDRAELGIGVGMLEHLADIRLPLEIATSVCLEAAQHCIFPAH